MNVDKTADDLIKAIDTEISRLAGMRNSVLMFRNLIGVPLPATLPEPSFVVGKGRGGKYKRGEELKVTRIPKKSNEVPKQLATIADRCINAIKLSGPMTSRQLLDALTAADAPVKGKRPIVTLYGTLMNAVKAKKIKRAGKTWNVV
jgi:hypothetical protein